MLLLMMRTSPMTAPAFCSSVKESGACCGADSDAVASTYRHEAVAQINQRSKATRFSCEGLGMESQLTAVVPLCPTARICAPMPSVCRMVDSCWNSEYENPWSFPSSLSRLTLAPCRVMPADFHASLATEQRTRTAAIPISRISTQGAGQHEDCRFSRAGNRFESRHRPRLRQDAFGDGSKKDLCRRARYSRRQ